MGIIPAMSCTPCELILNCRWLLPVAPVNEAIEHAGVAIDGGQIVAVGPLASINETYAPNRTVALDHHAVLPGLVNAHGHAAMSLLRGTAEDKPLQAWLTDDIWPLEAAHMSPEFVRTGTELALTEMISHGTTCFADMYFFPEVVAKCAKQVGLRAQVAFPVIKFANAWCQNTDEGFHKGLALHDDFRNDPLVSIAFGPHSAYAVSDADLEKTLMFADELGLLVQIHLHENQAEVSDAHERFGHSWIDHLHQRGMLAPNLQAVHMTQVTAAEIELVAEHNVHVVHCPHSNLKLASGICPTEAFAAAGVNVALGTDGAASNNTLDLFAEARLASLLAKQTNDDATAGSSRQWLHRATLGGAQALGVDAQTGSLEAGKSADIIALDLDHASLTPMYDPISAIVHGAAGASVSHVWVAGRCLYAEKTFQTLDVDDLGSRVHDWQSRIREGQGLNS